MVVEALPWSKDRCLVLVTNAKGIMQPTETPENRIDKKGMLREDL